MPSPQKQSPPQSLGQVEVFSPHSERQTPSPQKQLDGQSWGQLPAFSPHCGSQVPLPQPQLALQSAGQVTWFSPQLASQVPSPQAQVGVPPPVPVVPVGLGPIWDRPQPAVAKRLSRERRIEQKRS
jgi:hypothetical protein